MKVKIIAAIITAVLLTPVLGYAQDKNDNNPFQKLWDAIETLEERLDAKDDQDSDFVARSEYEANMIEMQGRIDELACRVEGGESCGAGAEDGDGSTGDGSDEEEYLRCGIGACANAVPKYVDGVLQECIPFQPTTEVCDGIDNDCNGVTDESFPDIGFDCDPDGPGPLSGIMTCQGSGEMVCQVW